MSYDCIYESQLLKISLSTLLKLQTFEFEHKIIRKRGVGLAKILP